MPKSRTQKKDEVQKLVETLRSMKTGVFTGFAGLTVPQATALRKRLAAEGVGYSVVKKTLLRRALTDAKLDPSMVDGLEGGIGFASSAADEVLPAKLLDQSRKEYPAVTLLGGIVDGVTYSAQQVQALAKLPTRLELLATLLRTLARPVQGIAQVLSGPARGLAQVLRAASQK